ncbi:porin [uncultured Alistipes sp.]|jgi:phosphate-selective porin O and P|uniref:porin n=1 Tax=uncultured Alistipes sp. TaxID=538949 RepID=UPI0025DEA5D1|nr:porin [uncultured Alistipes sp.]
MKILLPILFLLGVSGSSFARQADSLAAAPTVEELSAQVEALTAKTSTWDRILSALPKISGYVQTGYQWTDDSSTFFIKRVRLTLAGNIIPKLEYRVQIEFNSPKVVDAYLLYRPFNELNIQLGEYKLPFSIENTDYVPLKFEFIEYPLSLRKLMGFSDLSGLSATGRDMGAQLFGGFFRRDGYSILNYNIGVFNGEGINSSDKNKSKDFVARLTLKPVAGLQISGSYYWGEYGADYLKRVRFGAGACYDYGPVVVRGEYIGGTTGDMESGGWYAMAGWRVLRSLMPTFRYDTFREERSLSSTRQTNYTAGVTWQPVKYLRCQFNYTYEDFAARDRSGRNVVALMLTGMF